jgi:CheY-like chemotaxis protein
VEHRGSKDVNRHAATRPACILVVDDYSDVREAVQRLLERRGFRVITAADGAEAVTIATQHLPDVILMDISMPVLDGVAATAQLKASPRTAAIPVVGFTAHTFGAGMAERAKAAGMLDVLPKEAFQDLERVLRILTDICDSR